MIVFFSVTNFKSFRDKVEFNMYAGNYKRFPEHVCTSVTPNLLRASAIYGNNGAGKSNLLLAIEKLADIVLGYLTVESEDDLKPFKLDPACKNVPTTFEIEYITEKGNRYNYSISFLRNRIIEEWLVKVFPNNRVEELFERKLHNQKTILTVGDKKALRKNTKEQLRMEIYAEELDKKGNKPFFLEGFMEKQIKEFIEPFEWFFKNLQIVRTTYSYPGRICDYTNASIHNITKKIINSLSLGIKDIRVDSMPLEDFFGKGDDSNIENIKRKIDDDIDPIFATKGLIEYSLHKKDNTYLASKLVTIHNNDVEFEMYEESTGTQKILELIPSMIGAVLGYNTFIFDEIENSKHPEVIRALIEVYLSAGSKYSGQLIFSTHECNLLNLDLLRQDEIWFAEKDKDGVSHIYSLSDFKPRYDKDIRKGYLEGQFTKIPFFTHPKDLKWEDYEKE